MTATQETVKKEPQQALVNCTAFRDGMCAYASVPCKYRGRREDCKLPAESSLNHNPCPCPFVDWPLSCCAAKNKPFVKAGKRAARKSVRTDAAPEHCGEAMEKKGPSVTHLGKNLFICENCGAVALPEKSLKYRFVPSHLSFQWDLKI